MELPLLSFCDWQGRPDRRISTFYLPGFFSALFRTENVFPLAMLNVLITPLYSYYPRLVCRLGQPQHTFTPSTIITVTLPPTIVLVDPDNLKSSGYFLKIVVYSPINNFTRFCGKNIGWNLDVLWFRNITVTPSRNSDGNQYFFPCDAVLFPRRRPKVFCLLCSYRTFWKLRTDNLSTSHLESPCRYFCLFLFTVLFDWSK